MRKLITIFSFALFYITVAFGQATVDIQIMVHDNAGLSYPLWFGLDLTATDDIDPALGESDLPPPPPANAFDARWWIPPFNGSLSTWRDYRAPGDPPAFPYSGNKAHVIKIQSTDFPITVSWSLPPEINATSTIKDPFNLQVKSFSGTDSFIVTLSAIPYLEVSIDYSDITPVELTSFTASVLGQSVQLNWTTATELNNKGFEIQRKVEGSDFIKIGYVPGYGTTTEPKSYQFSDENLSNGIYSYRLKQIDFDGSFNYSNEVEAAVNSIPSGFALLQNYPNPFNPNTTIQFQTSATSDVTIKIYDVLGNEIKTLFAGQVIEGIHSVNWDGLNNSGLQAASGIYFYRMTAGNFVQSRQMILMK